MRDQPDSARALAAVQTLEGTRAEVRARFMPKEAENADGSSHTFPRSKTFRWLLASHPIGRSLGSAAVSLALTRLPIGLLITKALFRGR